MVYTDRTEELISSNGSGRPSSANTRLFRGAIVPVQIADYVKTSFAGQFIRKIDRNSIHGEVELSNGLEIKFDRKFQVVEIDD